ncbi:LURP-one-related/scramblase family protein [Alkalicoccobacillus porphyridii]|uniref:LURP-one-related family protein n=1 Tax=Alkalicoccobacillus porphyridii TaxID=2597270 RepID=A0A554A1M2_9BACI|nr:LURP-one-related family protein [Alkalicoccobacillus porphyridii]TSB47575.1 hypothetical protein FN960_03370 [Alkalicoccobacillus porphyridii]
MELYIKQRVFSFRDQFSVTDAQGNQLYEVQGKAFSFGDQLTLTEINGANQIAIKQKLASWMPRYMIEQDNRVIFEVVKKFSFFKTSFDILPSNWTVEGEIFKHHYSLKDGTKELMLVKKEWLTWGDTYHVTIHDEELVLPCLAIMIVLDMVLHNNKKNQHNNMHHNTMHHHHH